MKTFLIILFLTIISLQAILCQNPFIITNHQTLSIGSGVLFNFKAVTKTNIRIDFGDDTLIDYVIDTSSTKILGVLKGSKQIKIYGENISNFDCSGNHINNLTVYPDSTLKELICKNNLLDTLVLSQQSALNKIDCSSNKLKVLDVSEISSLTHLICNSNSYIENLNVSKNLNLIELSCFSNKIASIDLSNNKELLNIDICHNEFTALDLHENTKLKKLYCNDNKLTNLIFPNSLIELYCSKNFLTNLDLTNGSLINILGCGNNMLEQLDLHYCRNLEYLYCGNNKLSLLLLDSTRIKFLHCEHNLLTNINTEVLDTFLISLECSYNLLKSIDISKNKKILAISISNNKLEELNIESRSLKSIYCSNNFLTKIDISKINSLEGLDCDSNFLSELDLSNNQKLIYLNISNNCFTFKTLPTKEFARYECWYQKPIEIPQNFFVGDELDLSSQYSVNGQTTVYSWRNSKGSSISGCINNNGKLTFTESYTFDSIYCQLSNRLFPNHPPDYYAGDPPSKIEYYILRTTKTFISPKTTIDTSFCGMDSILIFDKYIKKEGIYSDTLTTNRGYDSVVVFNVIKSPKPYINLGNDTSISKYETLSLSVDSASLKSYCWSSGNENQTIEICGSKLSDLNYKVSIIVEDSNKCKNSDTINISEKIISVLQEDNNSFCKVYPNPTKGILNINSDKIESILMYDEMGRLLIEKKASNSNNEKLDISKLREGIYYLKIKSLHAKEANFKILKIGTGIIN